MTTPSASRVRELIEEHTFLADNLSHDCGESGCAICAYLSVKKRRHADTAAALRIALAEIEKREAAKA